MIGVGEIFVQNKIVRKKEQVLRVEYSRGSVILESTTTYCIQFAELPPSADSWLHLQRRGVHAK